MKDMQNTLIDNSDQFRLVNYLNELANDTKCNEICIATGYWDLKGTKLLYDALLPFFERGGKMRLLIGEEPTVRSYQLQTDIPKEEKFPDFYIQRDVNQLTEEYAPVAQMLLQYSNIEEQNNSQIQIRVYGQKGEEKKFLHAKCYIFLGEGQAYRIALPVLYLNTILTRRISYGLTKCGRMRVAKNGQVYSSKIFYKRLLFLMSLLLSQINLKINHSLHTKHISVC